MKRILFPKAQEGTFPIFAKESASDAFVEAICIGAGPVRDCELCGRVHFDQNGEYMDEGELEELLAKQKKEPKKYCSMDGAVHDGYIEDMQVVVNCPCNGLRLYEDFILAEARLICNFLVRDANERLEEAKEDAQDAAKALSAVE